MKNNYWLILGLALSTGLQAQQATNNPAPAAPAAAAPDATSVAAPAKTNAPAAPSTKKKSSKKTEKKSAAKKREAAADLRTVPLVTGPATVVASNVNVRGQAKLKSEVVARITKGQPVMVVEEVILNKSAPDEPSAWAKILLPPNVRVWVHGSFIDATNKTVIPSKLKLRAGPGENYSVLGMLRRGEAVKETNTKGEWVEIEPPSDAYAFVAAQYLKQEPAGAVASAPEPAPTQVAVNEPPAVVAATNEPAIAPPATEPAASTNGPEPAAVEEPPAKRIVEREGIVRGTISIQAPTKFELVSPDNHRTINYLYTTSVNLDLRRYKGLRIIVTGEEGLDERWRNTPVITIQRIQVIE
ncbi:MAG: hypothetical protein QOJ40_2218 [Verrucomicrobiota bacterium]